ncbi:hypothetical protein D9M69_687230 [compost metagenome]
MWSINPVLRFVVINDCKSSVRQSSAFALRISDSRLAWSTPTVNWIAPYITRIKSHNPGDRLNSIKNSDRLRLVGANLSMVASVDHFLTPKFIKVGVKYSSIDPFEQNWTIDKD